MNVLRKIPINLLKKNKSLTRSLYSFKGDPTMKRLKEKQANFQRDDGLPVYLKGGKKDKILFNLSLFLLGICSIDTISFWYRHM